MNKEIISKVMEDETPLIVEIDIARAWLILSWVQLACRHPSVKKEMRERLKEVIHPFEDAITSLHPEAQKQIDFGWRK